MVDRLLVYDFQFYAAEFRALLTQTKNVSSYFAELIGDSLKDGFNKLTVILDNNSTYKHKTRS